MNSINKKNEGLDRTLDIEILRIDINEEVEKNINKESDKINLKGFRKGKIPKKLIIEIYGETIYNDVKMDLLNKKIKEHIIKENIDLVNNPVIVSEIDDKKNNLMFKIKYEIFPKINLNIEKIKARKINIKIKEDDIKKEIEYIQQIYGTWNVVENDEIKYGDKVNIDIFEKNNKNIKKYNNKNINLILDNKEYFIKNLKEKIIFCKAIGKYDFYVKEDEIVNEITNIIITIHIKKFERFFPAMLNMDLAKKLNIENVNIDTISDYAKFNIEKKIKHISYSILKNDILEQLINVHEFDIPSSIITKEVAEKKNTVDEIIKDVKLKLLLNEIRSKFNIEISENQIQEKLNSLYPNVSKKVYKNLLNNLLIDEIIKFLIEKIDLVEIDKTINDLINEGFIK